MERILVTACCSFWPRAPQSSSRSEREMEERSGAGAPPLPGEAATPGEADGPTSWQSGRKVNAPITGRITAKPSRRRRLFPVVLNISRAEGFPLSASLAFPCRLTRSLCPNPILSSDNHCDPLLTRRVRIGFGHTERVRQQANAKGLGRGESLAKEIINASGNGPQRRGMFKRDQTGPD